MYAAFQRLEAEPSNTTGAVSEEVTTHARTSIVTSRFGFGQHYVVGMRMPESFALFLGAPYALRLNGIRIRKVDS